MVKTLSETKVSKMFTLYFKGLSQTEISNKLKITQASVSIHISKFKSLVEQQGIMAVAEEYGVMDQVKELYDLATDLKEAKRTVEEASDGLKMELLFQECGVAQENYGNVIEICEKLKQEDCFNAAFELNSLEKGTGFSYKELVDEYKGFTDQLNQATENLQKITGEIHDSTEELTETNKHNKLAIQDLKIHMQKLGLDEHRLEIVEALALSLKKAKISNQGLQDYIKRQELLNKAELSIDVFSDILDKSKVVTLGNKGKKLLDLLTECGSLVEAIDKQQAKKQALLKEVSNLEEQASFKGTLEAEVSKLKADKATLEAHIAVLEKQEKSYNIRWQNKQIEIGQLMLAIEQEQASLQGLKEKKTIIEKEISDKQTTNQDLDININLKQQKVSDLTQLEGKKNELTNEMNRVGTRLDKEKERLVILDGFLGLVQLAPAQGLKGLAPVLPTMLKDAEQGIHSPELLRNQVLGTLTGGTFKIWRCPECNAMFYVDKLPSAQGYVCPCCHSDPIFLVYKNETEMLRIVLPNYMPIKSPVVAFEMISKPLSTKSQELSDNKGKPGGGTNTNNE